jgi:hypothetical protein
MGDSAIDGSSNSPMASSCLELRDIESASFGLMTDNVDAEIVSTRRAWHKVAKIKYRQCLRGNLCPSGKNSVVRMVEFSSLAEAISGYSMPQSALKAKYEGRRAYCLLG